jgi:metallo-beta-lactamase class B
MNQRIILVTLLSMLAACSPKELQPDAAFECSNCERWNEPQEPFRIYGNTWYVGTSGLTSLLIETVDGLILIDAGLPQSAALIDANIRHLGFDPTMISAILLSQESPHCSDSVVRRFTRALKA